MKEFVAVNDAFVLMDIPFLKREALMFSRIAIPTLHEILSSAGNSDDFEIRYLLPDYNFEFSLGKPYYHPKILNQKLTTGVNTLNFGIMDPELLITITNPKQLWQLLPFSN